jgi:hypothetical protein
MALGKQAKTGKAVPFKLTERHARFCRNIMAGMSQRAAYALAGFSPKFYGGPTALMKRPEIKQRLKVLREAQRIRLKVTLDSLVLDLRTGQELAIKEANPTAYVAATMGLAKLMGFLKDDRAADEINIFINRPLREPTKELELSPDQWVAKWAPKLVDKTNGHGNGHDGNGKDQG